MPNKYYIDRKNNLRQVPKEKEADFLKKYPGSREATSKELSDFEDMMFRKRQSNEGEAGIQKEQNSSTTKLPANNPLMGNQFGFDVPNYSEQFKPENYKIDLRQPDNTPTKIFSGDSPFASKTLEQTINDTRKNMPISPEAYFDMATDRYKSEKEHIEQIKNDNTIPESVKQSLIKDYQENIRTSDDLTVDDKNLPPAARDWLERNKVERQVVQYMPSIMGGGSYTTTVRENTPEQIAFIKDYIANSAEGKRYAQAHKEFIGQLESQADTLLDEVNSIRDKSAKDKEAYAKKHNISTWTLKGTNYRNDALLDKAANLLKNTKLLLSSNREGGGFWKGLHMTNEDLKELAVITESFYNDKVLNQVIDKYQKDPNSLSKEENIIIQAKYIADQISAGVDPGSWYNIGATTKQSLPFMRDFIMTAPIGGGAGSLVKGGASALASKTGANLLLSRGIGPSVSKLGKGAIDLLTRREVQTALSPSTYSMAYEGMQGQAVDRDENGNVKFADRGTFEEGYHGARIENESELIGEIFLDGLMTKLKVPTPKFLKTKLAKRISSTTGIQGPFVEYLEEKYGEARRGDFKNFFDPRQNLETFGAVAIMQIPFSAINSTGYGIGKIRDVQAKRAIRQTYDKSRSNLIEFFGEDAEIATESFNNLVDNSTEEELKNELQSVIEDKRLDDKAKRAIVEYVTSYSAYSGINKAKQEQIQQAQEEATQRLQENINPQMNAVVSAVVAGFDKPIQIVGGNIVQREDGSIDREASDKQIFYIDPNDGSRKVIAIDFVENIDESILSEDAAIQLSERAAEEVTAEYENDEVREHQQGEVVRVSLDGNSFVVGQIEGRDETTGDYILTIQTPNGVQQMPIQPRNIVNEDNLIGVENESLVKYIDENDEIKEGVVATNDELYAMGVIGFENGDVIPIADIIGLVDESVPEEITDSQETVEIPDKNDQSVTTAPSEQNILSLNQLPKDSKGNILFESVSVENTISALGEVYDSTEIPSVVDATIANIEKQVEKAKSPKPTGDITKDIANKQKANQELESLNNRLAYWNDVKSAIQASRPIEQQVAEQLTGEEYIPQSRENEHLWNVAENSDNPIDIANAYNEAMQFAGEETLQPWEQELLGRRVNRASFEMFGDRNWINGTIARAWFNRKGEESNTGSIDIIAQELGTDVQSIVEFIVSHPSNRIKQGNELTDALNAKFKELAKEITGREVGGIESNSGKLFLATMEYAANNTPTEAEMTLAESNVVLDIPQPVQFFLNDYMGIYEMANFNQFREAVEEADAQGYFMFPLEPKDKEVILNYIDYAEQQTNTVRDSNEELSSKPTIEDGEKIVSLNPEKTLTDEQREEISQSIPQGTGSESVETDSGDGTHQRVSQRADREGLEVSRGMETAASNYRGRETSTSDARQVVSGKGSKREQLDALESYARESGIWIEDTSILGEQFSQGGENEVLYTPNTNTVFKLNNFEYAGDDVVNFFDRIDAHNNLFPNSYYTLVGFAKNSKGETSAVLEQPFIIESNRLVTIEEIAKYMQGLGFEQVDEDTYVNKDYEVFDAFSNNVLLGADGLLYPIDTQIRKNKEALVNEKPDNPSSVFKNKLTELFPNGVKLYHRTTADNWASIQNDGQIDVSEEVDGVHTVLGNPNIDRIGGKDTVLLEINVPVENYDRLVPEEATYWQDFSESDVEFDNYDMMFDTYMSEHPDLIGGDIIYADNIPLSMVTVYEPTISDKIAQAEAKTETNPTEAQKKAGNYKKGKVTIQGFRITIESVKGEERSGTDATGKKWSVTLNNSYGYFRKTEGKDKDHIDLFLGNNPESKQVFVIDQVNRDGSFDEHKVMFGFDSIEEAREAYLSNYEEGWQGLGNITQVDVDTFRKWTESDTRRIKPFAEYKEIKESTPAYGSSNSVFTQNAYEEARKKLRDKLNNMNTGFDPEMILLSTQVAGYHIEAGVRKLADLAARMIEDLGDGIRPYIKSAYESVRYYPGMADVAKEMDSIKSVMNFDVDNFDKQTNKQSKSKKETSKQDEISQQLSIFDSVESNTNDYGTEPRVLQTNNNRLPRRESTESVQGVEERERTRSRSREQSETISKDDGAQRQSTRREGSVLQRDADLLEPALVEYNIEDNDVESFNQSKKYDDNIAAIEVVIDALKNKRKATPAEKEILSKYVGFGGLKDILYSPDNESSWTKTNSRYREQVRKIIELSKEVDSLTGKDTTLSDIRGSILNAHYTSATVIRAMYDGLTKLGFKGGRVLEPSAGIGNFISYMPKHIQKNSSVTAVELDNLTGNILRLIHDDADTRISGIQDVAIPDNSQDLVISNIPFGNYRIYDKAFKGEKEKFLNRINNYFFIKALDKAREGGIVALVTSKGVLDSPGNQDVREYLNSHANFLGAVRLPNTTFKNVANTEVVTDIIFMQKNTQSQTNNEDFISIEKVEAVHKDGEIQEVGINNYFSKHPNNMLGEIEAGGLYSRDDYTLKDNGTAENLNKIIKDFLPKDIFKPVESGAGLQANDITRTILEVKQGNIFFNDGKLYRNQEGQAEEIKINEPQAKLESYISLRDTLMDLIYSEYIGKPDSEVEALRNDLNKQYDVFTKKYGKLEKSLPKIARQDADGYNVLSLENEGKKADIFSKRTIAPISTNNRAENIDEAIIMSLYENASIDIERIAELLNLPLDETIVLSKGKLFQEPVTGQFVTREEYLSGNVKKKLKEAKQAVDSGYTEFTNNVTELEKVIPADIPAVHIEARMGSRWIPAEIYSQFAKELLNSDSASVTYSKSTDTYYDSGKVNTVEATNKYGTGRVNGMDIIIKALMISPPKVYDTHKENGKDVRVLNVQETSKANEKYEDVRNAFEDWVYRDLSRRELLSGIYNERYNTTVKRTYNGDHLNVPGINGVNLRPHQKDAVWMLLQNNGGIIDHLVGAGKTFVMIAAAQEMRRTGIAKKPMITALKSTIPQIVESYRSAYPMAKILAPTEKDFQKENRRKLFSKIANNEWDCIIMSHENYGKIPHELDIQRKFVQDEIDEIESERVQMEIDGASKQAIKGLETRIKNLEARLEKLADLDKDNSITFQQMGIDHIIVDESQQFKNLSYVTKQRGVAGLGKPEGSKRAFNLFMGIRYLQEKYNADKGTTFLSGTPISNSMVEMYTLLKYLRPSKLQELNMTSFDAWATTFAVPTSDIEFTVTGDFKQKTRFREFINVPELSLMYTEIADIRTDDNLKLDKPKMKGGGYTVETIQMNDEQIEFGQALMEFARTKDGTVIGRGPLGEKEKSAAMLIATNLSSKMAIDMRLIDPSYSYDPNGKIAKAVENVYRIYNETNDFLGTQLVFSDLGTPKNTKSKSSLLRDYMEDELGANIDTLNEIFGDPNAAGFRFPSIKTVTNKIVEVLEMSEAEVADMIQEAENSVGGFNVYDEVKLRLIEKGVPENQIVFIHDYNTQRQKEKLFEQVNNGQIRIILGSTQKLGTGVNVQERASAIHHIDVPWTPAAMEQRNGRVIRQGNWAAKKYLNNEVPVYAYATERTLDAYKYQLLQTKQHFLNQVKSGSIEDRVVKESDADSESGVSYAELVAMLSGNQDILLKSKLEGQLDKLKRAKRNFEGELYEAIDKRDNLISKVPSIQSNIDLTRQNIESLTNNIKLDKDGKLIIDTINGEKIKKPSKDKKTVERIDYGKKAIDIINKNTSFATNSLNLGGYEIEYSASSLLDDQKVITNLVADNGVRYTVGFSFTPGIFLNNLQKTIEGIPSILEKQEAALEKNLKDTKAYDEIINKGHNWEKQSEYDRVQQELKEVLDRLKETEVKEETTIDDVEETEDIIVDETNFTEHAAQVAREVVPVEETKETTKEDTDKELLASPATEYKHTKTGNIHGLVKLNKELPREEYLQVARIARKHKGKWSNYTKGFLFYDTDNANKFSEEVNKSDIRYQQSGNTFIPLDDAQARELIKLLKKTGLAVDVVLDENIKSNQQIKDAQGNVYGYVTPEGVIHLDATRMNANTPMHEFGHLWNDYIKKNNPKLYQRGVELIKQSPYYWERIYNNPAYSNLSEEAKIDEALAMAYGDKGERFVNRSMKQRFIDWLADVWKSIKKAFGINTDVAVEDMSLSDFTDRAVNELLGGKKLNGLTSDIDNIRFHSVNDIANANNSLMTEEARIELDMRLKSRIFDIRESWEDRYLAVKEFQDVLRNRGMNIEEHNDFYLKATHLSGMNDSQLEVYRKMYQQPLNKAIRQLEKKGFSYRDIENYAILKHGIERNEWMRQNAINEYMKQHPEATPEQIEGYSKRLPKDFAGVTAVEQEVGATAEEFITEFENQVGSDLIDSFWEKVNAATQFSLKKNLEGQLINQKTYDELIARYEYYIPLRGHDETVAEDRWDYTPQMGTFFVNPLLKANGRRSRSETPFAFIAQQAQSSITAANKNILTQTILRLANKDKTGLMSVNRAWYELKGEQDGQPLWEQVQAEYSSDPDTYRKNIEMFEAKMQTLAEAGQAFQSGKKLNIGGLFIKPKQAEQHEVHVYQNGIDYVIYINANPAVAKAINGSNIKETSDVMKKVAKMSRFMAANFTTRNPIFVATNFSRDYIFASSILPVKESMKYALQFQKNIPEAVGALQRYIRNKADLTKEADRYMMEYIMNGAKTGYSHIVEIQSVQKEIEKDIKKGDHRNIAERIFQVFGAANEFAENLSRFSVYMTSRKDGRSIVRSVSDAKEVTVNFNRSGAGGTIANFVRPAYLFVNAGIQAFSNIVKVAVKNPKKISALFAFYTLSGAIMAPALALLLGGDDGLDDYYNLGEWERQNNLCLYTGKGFIKIPLPHELRVFHRTGDNILHALAGKKDVTEAMIEIPLGFSDLIPIDPMGAVEASWAEYTPDFMKPFTQLAANRNFMGGRIYNEWIDPNTPGYLKARTNKKGKPFTPDILVNTSKTLDNITGGDGVEQGLISINPDLVEHFARGYFGGLYSTAMQSINFASKLAGFNKSGDITIRDTPLKTFFTSNEDLNVSSSGINNKFYKIKDEVKEIRRKIKGYENQANKGDISVEDFSAKISKLSKDIEKLQRVYPLMQEIDKHEKALKDLDGEDQKKVERAISDWKKQVIEINSIK